MCAPEVDHATAVAQIFILETKLAIPHLSELGVERRFSSCHHRRQRGPLGEPPHGPDLATVPDLCSHCQG
jgi:hypothetical protein